MAREKAIGQEQRARQRKRNQRATGRDMAISLLVLLIPIFLIVWFFQRTPDRPTVEAVDVQPVVAEAHQAGMTVQTPTLPGGWTAVRATYTALGGQLLGRGTALGNTIVLGYQGPDQHYYSMNQQQGHQQAFVLDFTGQGHQDGTSTIAGNTWQRWTSQDGSDHSLVREVGGSTVVVTSSAGYDALGAFAGTLS